MTSARPLRLTLSLLSAWLLTAVLASAADSPEPGFVPLCDGSTFAGWHGATENYQFEEGVLQCRPTRSGNIYTDAEYADFVLRFDFRLTPGANNGIGLRVPDGGHASYEGMEIQILDDTAEKYANLKPYQAHGSVYGIISAEKGHLNPVGEWNTQEIRCVGRRVTILLNGHTIVDGDLDEATREGPLDKREHPGVQRTTGRLCLCTHGSHVDFRNLRIRVLAAGEQP